MSFKPKHSRLTAASKVLEGTLKAYRLERKVSEYSAFPEWPEIVGAEIAAVAVPEKIVKRKLLVVRVIDAAWTQELSFRKRELLELLSGFGTPIEDVRFVTGDPISVAEKKKGAKRTSK